MSLSNSFSLSSSTSLTTMLHFLSLLRALTKGAGLIVLVAVGLNVPEGGKVEWLGTILWAESCSRCISWSSSRCLCLRLEDREGEGEEGEP